MTIWENRISVLYLHVGDSWIIWESWHKQAFLIKGSQMLQRNSEYRNNELLTWCIHYRYVECGKNCKILLLVMLTRVSTQISNGWASFWVEFRSPLYRE